MTIQKIPYDGEKRVESGAIQFGEDWPGLFLRGDNAFAHAMNIHEILSWFEVHKPAGMEDIYLALSSLKGFHESIMNDVVVKPKPKEN